MSLIGMVLFLILIGILLVYIPMESRIKSLVVVIVCVVAILWLALAIGLLPLHDVGVPRIR